MKITEDDLIFSIADSKEEIKSFLEDSGDGAPSYTQGGLVYFESSNHRFKKWDYGPGPIAQSYSAPFKITSREIESYPRAVQEVIDSGLQYLEIGTGLSEPVCHIAARAGSLGYIRPIAIDPIDYSLLERVLLFAQNEAINHLGKKRSIDIIDMHFQRIGLLIERCRIMQDPEKVWLVNTTFEEAFSSGKLRGIADYAVDFWGPKINSDEFDSELQKFIDLAECSFLKPDGRLIQLANYAKIKIYDAQGREKPSLKD